MDELSRIDELEIEENLEDWNAQEVERISDRIFKKIFYIILPLSLFLSVYYFNTRYFFSVLISFFSYYMSLRYRKIKVFYYAFLIIVVFGIMLTIPNIKESFVIELFFLPFFISIHKYLEHIPTSKKLLLYLSSRAFYYLMIYNSVSLTFFIVGSGKGMLDLSIIMILFFFSNVIYFALLVKWINELIKNQGNYYFLSRSKGIAYSFLYTLIILLFMLYVFPLIGW